MHILINTTSSSTNILSSHNHQSSIGRCCLFIVSHRIPKTKPLTKSTLFFWQMLENIPSSPLNSILSCQWSSANSGDIIMCFALFPFQETYDLTESSFISSSFSFCLPLKRGVSFEVLLHLLIHLDRYMIIIVGSSHSPPSSHQNLIMKTN